MARLMVHWMDVQRDRLTVKYLALYLENYSVSQSEQGLAPLLASSLDSALVLMKENLLELQSDCVLVT